MQLYLWTCRRGVSKDIIEVVIRNRYNFRVERNYIKHPKIKEEINMKTKVLSILVCVSILGIIMSGCGSGGGTASTTKVEANKEEIEKTGESKAEEVKASEKVTVIEDAIDYGMPFTATELSKGKTFGVSVQTHTNAFFLAEVEAVKETLAQGGIEATVLAPDPAMDINTQVEQVTEFCTRGADVIFVDPIDCDGIKPALEEAKRAGIPVIAIDSVVTDNELVVTTIESDNTQLGRMAAEALCEAMGGKGKIGVIHWSTLQCVRERVDGLKAVVEEKYPEIEIVAEQDAYGVVEDAQAIMESYMQSYPDITGVFAINSPTGQGAVAAIQAANKKGEISVITVDGSQNDIDMIKEGQILCSPVQFPASIANKAVECAELIWAGKDAEVENHIYISGDNITIENIDDYDGNTY